MEPLNHFLRSLLFYCICTLSLRADVVPFFDPTTKHKSSTYNLNIQEFIANEPISLTEFFGDWEHSYHPKDGKNIALQMLRVDVGGEFLEDYYLGYFYQYDVFIKTNKDFSDFYHTIKNKKEFYHDRNYRLDLTLEGIQESGLILSKRFSLYHDSVHRLLVGAGVDVRFGHEMQDGFIQGSASSPSQKRYVAQGSSRYHYTQNYLYDLDVGQASGFGYGGAVALDYYNRALSFGAKVVVNDIFARMYWRDLPFSKVDIQTKNKDIDADGYTTYHPSISGLEKREDFTQKISPRVKVVLEKELYPYVKVFVGLERVYGENFPYVRFSEQLDDNQEVLLGYENRFHTFGVDYRYESFMIGVSADAFSHFSALGLRASFQHQF